VLNYTLVSWFSGDNGFLCIRRMYLRTAALVEP
jgi:hypothetical protein